MFRNKLLLVMIISFLFLITTGCGSKTASTGNNEQKGATSTAGSTDNTKQPVLPKSAPDMTGKVKTIEGNKLTVYKVNMTNNNRPPENMANNNSSPEERAKLREQMGNSSQKEPPKAREEMFQVTDETVNLVISADAHIVKGFGKNSNNNETTQLSIGDIKTGDILGLRFGEKLQDGIQSVNFIQILQ